MRESLNYDLAPNECSDIMKECDVLYRDHLMARLSICWHFSGMFIQLDWSQIVLQFHLPRIL